MSAIHNHSWASIHRRRAGLPPCSGSQNQRTVWLLLLLLIQPAWRSGQRLGSSSDGLPIHSTWNIISTRATQVLGKATKPAFRIERGWHTEEATLLVWPSCDSGQPEEWYINTFAEHTERIIYHSLPPHRCEEQLDSHLVDVWRTPLRLHIHFL